MAIAGPNPLDRVVHLNRNEGGNEIEAFDGDVGDRGSDGLRNDASERESQCETADPNGGAGREQFQKAGLVLVQCNEWPLARPWFPKFQCRSAGRARMRRYR